MTEPAAEATGATLAEAGPAARFVLQGDEAALARVAALCGLPLPAAIHRAEGAAEDRALLRLGPDEYLLIAPGEDAFALAPQLNAALAGAAASCVDVSDRQIAFRLDGRGGALALNSGVPLDLSIESFPVGMTTRTIFEKAEILLWRVGEDAFRIEVARSVAPYLRALIGIALRENAAAP